MQRRRFGINGLTRNNLRLGVIVNKVRRKKFHDLHDVRGVKIRLPIVFLWFKYSVVCVVAFLVLVYTLRVMLIR